MSTLAIVCITSESLCLIICIILFACQHTREPIKDKLSNIYTQMLIANICVLISNIMGWLVDGKTQIYAIIIAHISTFFLHFCWYVLATLMFHYVFVVISYKVRITKSILYSEYVFCAVMIFLLIISQFTDWFYYYDEGNFYNRGSLHIISYGIALSNIISVLLIYKYRKQLGSNDTFTIAFFLVLPFMSLFPQIAVYGLFSLNTCQTIGLLILYIRIQAVRSKQREMELVNARVDIMLSQIQPHFLYNTLATIENVTRKDAEKASEMISDFSEYLRENMNSLSQKKLIPFKQEAKHITTYLNFEKERFKERLNVVYDFKILDFYIPVLTVQPLVENAVRHGVSKKREGGTVHISSKEVLGGVEIIIADDGVGFIPSLIINNGFMHIGLENVRSRLMAQCGGTLNIESVTGVGTTVTLFVPTKNL